MNLGFTPRAFNMTRCHGLSPVRVVLGGSPSIRLYVHTSRGTRLAVATLAVATTWSELLRMATSSHKRTKYFTECFTADVDARLPNRLIDELAHRARVEELNGST